MDEMGWKEGEAAKGPRQVHFRSCNLRFCVHADYGIYCGGRVEKMLSFAGSFDRQRISNLKLTKEGGRNPEQAGGCASSWFQKAAW